MRSDDRSTPGPEVAVLAELVLAVARKIHVRESAVEGLIPLTNLESLVMRTVDHDPGITPSGLASALRMKSSNTSAALRSLEAKGLIAREQDNNDARSVRVVPTPLAAENVSSVMTMWNELLAPLISSDTDVRIAVRLLKAIDAGLTPPT